MRKTGRGEVVRVGSLFDQYKKRFTAPQKTVVVACIAVLKEVFSIELHENQCSYKPQTRTLSLTVSGTIKTEIQLQKQKILALIRERVGDNGAPTNIL